MGEFSAQIAAVRLVVVLYVGHEDGEDSDYDLDADGNGNQPDDNAVVPGMCQRINYNGI